MRIPNLGMMERHIDVNVKKAPPGATPVIARVRSVAKPLVVRYKQLRAPRGRHKAMVLHVQKPIHPICVNVLFITLFVKHEFRLLCRKIPNLGMMERHIDFNRRNKSTIIPIARTGRHGMNVQYPLLQDGLATPLRNGCK